MKKPTFTPYKARDGWRCRLGLHQWKPVLSFRDPPRAFVGGALCAGFIYVRTRTSSEPRVWRNTGRKCSRCGKRA